MTRYLLLCGVLGIDPLLACLVCGEREFRELELIGYVPADPWEFRDDPVPDGCTLAVPYPLCRSCHAAPTATAADAIRRVLYDAAKARRAERNGSLRRPQP